MNTDESAEAGKNTATASEGQARKGPRIAGRVALLAIGLLVALGGIAYLADTLRGIILDMESADRGEWASLLGGGLGAWAFFLIRSGIIEHTFDLVPKARAVMESLPIPEWSTFLERTLDFSRTLLLPGVVTVFALVFVGEHVRDQILVPSPSPTSRQIDELGTAINARLDIIDSTIGNRDLPAELDAQGYTRERAERLDLIGVDDRRPDYYFARFPISFEEGNLSEEGTVFVSGTEYDADDNSELVSRLVNALVHCGALDDPVMLRVEGYASSEPFDNTTASVTSDGLNVRLANERRRAVKDALDSAIAATGLADAERRMLVVEADDYQTIAEMEADREFNDRPTGDDTNALPQDFLTRAAHIKVLSPGTCRVRSD